MKSFRTFKRRKSDRIDAIRLHDLANSLRTEHTSLFNDFFSKADDFLFEKSKTGNDEADFYFDQLRELRIKKNDITEAIDLEFDQWFNWREGERPSLEQIEEEKRLSAENEWSLMEDHSLEKSLAIESFSTRVIDSSRNNWETFFQRISVLTADKDLKEHECPFNPSKIASFVFDAIEKTELEFKTVNMIFRLYDEITSRQFGLYYQHRNNWLIEEGILPNLKTEDLHPKRPSGVTPSTIDQITQSISGSNGSNGVVIDPAVLQNLIHSVSALQHQDSDVPDVADLHSVKEWASQQACTVTQQFQGSDKSDVISLVSILFEYFFEDGQLSDQMKHLLARMQIPIIKVAILDKDFFENNQHTARLLLNKMARAATGWQPNDNLENDLLLKGMENIVHRLNHEFENDLTLFDELLDEFEHLKIGYEKNRNALINDTKHAEELALAEHAKKDRALIFLNKLFEDNLLPDDIQNMLKTDWHRLMRYILTKQGESQNWRNSARIAKELVWSLQATVQYAYTERFTIIVPKMLSGLEDGLHALGRDDTEISALLASISKQHIQNQIDTDLTEEQIDRAKETAVTEFKDTSSEAEELIQGPIPLPVVEPEIMETPADLNYYLSLIDELTESSWFDYYGSDETLTRICLSLIVAEGAKYVFSDNRGKKILERSAIGLALALRNKDIIAIDRDPLIDRTLLNVAEKLEQN